MNYNISGDTEEGTEEETFRALEPGWEEQIKWIEDFSTGKGEEVHHDCRTDGSPFWGAFGRNAPLVRITITNLERNDKPLPTLTPFLQSNTKSGSFKTNLSSDEELLFAAVNFTNSLEIEFVPISKNKKRIVEKVNSFLSCFNKIEKNRSDFFVVTKNSHGHNLVRVESKPSPIKGDDYELFYGANFPAEEIFKFSDAQESLMLLHGPPGTGKTNFIKLALKKFGRKVIYVPPFMASWISSPDFLPFLLKEKGSILLLEDAEDILSAERSTATSNILNLSDGFLKDCLDIKIIATFNIDISKIDDALLRDGRIYMEHKFRKLSASEANKLSEACGLEKHFESGEHSIAEIFNAKKKSPKTLNQERRIGFA